MELSVNYLAVLIAALSSLVVGAVWYAKPVFWRPWSKLVGLDEAKANKGAPKAIAISFVMALVMAYVLAHVATLSQAFYGTSDLQTGLLTAFWLWLGLSATTIVTHHAFEQRHVKLTLLALGNQLVTLLVMGAIIGGMGLEWGLGALDY